MSFDKEWLAPNAGQSSNDATKYVGGKSSTGMREM